MAGWAQVGHDNNVMVEVVEEHYRAGMAVVVAQAFHRYTSVVECDGRGIRRQSLVLPMDDSP